MNMKTILGLDLGTTSIGWALVKEGENAEIIKTGVRVIPLTTDETTNFEKGKSITTNADRTLKRAARRNLQRYKLRRENLIDALVNNKIITKESVLCETTNNSTFETYKLRSDAATSKINLEEFARVLLMINKKRGYKSSRKVKGEEEGSAIDSLEITKKLYEENLTPGQYAFELLRQDKFALPDFYRSDLKNEFELIWNYQSTFYPFDLSNENKEKLIGKTKAQTAAICYKELKFEAVELKGKMSEKKFQRYSLRSRALSEKLLLGELVEVFAEINGNIANSSGYLGAISDRSKELYFNKITIGQYLYKQLIENSNTRLKGQVFYRQDYLDEFESIWETQASFYSKLTPTLKKEIRDIIIFYQRRLKSQKGLLSTCELESEKKEILIKGVLKSKLIGPKVCPKSSPLFQEFKILSQLNNVEILEEDGKTKVRKLDQGEINFLFNILNNSDKLTSNEINKLLGFKVKYKYNFDSFEGNRTRAAFIKSAISIIELSGNDNVDFEKLNGFEQLEVIKQIFAAIGINNTFFDFNSSKIGKELEQEPFYKLWHLIYSYEGDKSKSGIDSLVQQLNDKYQLEKEYAVVIANTSLQPDYSSLSTKAIQKILPFLKEGNIYSDAASLAGYNHSNSKTKEENEKRNLKDKLDILSKNSLRNPVVEKIVNQMINVVNAIVDTYGKPDEIRVELARDLKKSSDERAKMTKSIGDSTRKHEDISKLLKSEFQIQNPTRNDVLRYKLYEELKDNGYKTLYSNQYIPREKLFSGEIDIEHIIPQSRLFDDSFSNKTLEYRAVNIKKSNATALDFVSSEYGEEGKLHYIERVKSLFNKEGSKTKYRKLLWSEKDIPDNFINRDLGDTRYITKKSKEILEELVRNVYTTTGIITDRLRNDWGLVDVLKELNLPKYQTLGMTEIIENRNGDKKEHIKDWTKRNDHRHHAMDAITVAFTKPSYIQYLNNLNARSDKSGSIYGIEQKELYRDEKNKLKFNPPMPLDIFRKQAKEHLANTLISFKAKNKVTTKNKNTTTKKGGTTTKIVETPRGQLHLETIYGASKKYETKLEKVNASFDLEKINTVANKKYREALLKRLADFDNDPKKAFTGKNSVDKNPIYVDKLHTYAVPNAVKTVSLENQYTIRKAISPDLKLDKVIDTGIRKILETRMQEFGNDPKKAFVNLDENPIYLNKEKGITIKSIKISGVANAIALHTKKDKFGKEILNEQGLPIPVDFVNTGNNHHVAIYRDDEGNLHEEVVSFLEAVTRKNMGETIVRLVNENGYHLVFTLKQNEYFVFPNEKTGFNPNTIDLLDEKNSEIISPNLFRVQKLTSKDYWFRHHLETLIEVQKELKDTTWKRISSLSPLNEIIKVRLNHLGQIVQVGEY
jgi:CRISPR-associated endonuclease Csn1